MEKNKKKKKKFLADEESNRRERPPEQEEEIENQNLTQKKIAFAQSPHLEAVLQLLKECGGVSKLLGDNEYQTVVNAATLDAQQEMITKFITAIDNIKKGGLTQSS